jgi:hypothetical protein
MNKQKVSADNDNGKNLKGWANNKKIWEKK